MCISVLEDYLLSYKHHIKSVSAISADSTNHSVCCKSECQAYSRWGSNC